MSLVFDFDGVLVDSREENIAAINRFAEKYNFDNMTIESYTNMLAFNFYEYWQMMLGERADKFFTDLRFVQRINPVLHQGMKDILIIHKPTIVSSNYSELIKTVLQEENIVLDIYGGDYDTSKIRKLNKLRRQPDIFVTDTVGDVEEGKQAQYIVVAVTWGFNSLDMLQKSKPHYIVQTPQELHEVLIQFS